MLRSVQIILKGNPVYYIGGDKVSGLILLEVVDKFEMYGYAIEAGNHTACSTHENFNLYLKKDVHPNLFNEQNRETKHLNNGYHFIPFEFDLPAESPNSFKVLNRKDYSVKSASTYYDFLFYYVKFYVFSSSLR